MSKPVEMLALLLAVNLLAGWSARTIVRRIRMRRPEGLSRKSVLGLDALGSSIASSPSDRPSWVTSRGERPQAENLDWAVSEFIRTIELKLDPKRGPEPPPGPLGK